MIVQEFHSDMTNKEKIAVNKRDLYFFVNFMSDSAYKNLDNNSIIGPIKQINLCIGKY